jgi:hypothetical protein
LNRNERQKMDTMVYEAGKGDRYRNVDQEKYANNYDLIFGKKKNEPVQDSSSTQCPVAQVGDSGEEAQKA